MALPFLIGVTGRARHGKDTVGKLLEEYGYRRFAFADTLKAMALVLNPIVGTGDELYERFGDDLRLSHGEAFRFPPLVRLKDLIETLGEEEAKKWPEVRRFYQVLGTDAARGFLGGDVWIDALAKKVVPLCTNKVPVVITDVRFPNEAAWIRRLGGEVWRVVRPEEEAGGIPAEHPSEANTSTIPADLIILNDGDISLPKLRHYIGQRGLPETAEWLEWAGVTPPSRTRMSRVQRRKR